MEPIRASSQPYGLFAQQGYAPLPALIEGPTEDIAPDRTVA